MQPSNLLLQSNGYVIQLKRGAYIVQTQTAGLIQFGMPLNGVVEIQELGLTIPQIYVVPSIRFHKKQALTLAELKIPLLFNFFEGREITIICSKQTKEILQRVYQLQNNQRPDDIEKKVKYYESIDANPRPDYAREFAYISNLVSNQNMEDSIKYIVFDYGDLQLTQDCLIRKSALGYAVQEMAVELAKISEQIEITYVEEVNWDMEIKNKFEIPLQNLKSMQEIKVPLQKPKAITRFKPKLTQEIEELVVTHYDTQPPPFGVTFLENPQGVLSIGFIIWINGRGAIVDPPPYTTQILKKLQISQAQIEWIILTQNDSENDGGAFQKIFDSSKIEIITIEPIIDIFMQKYSSLSGMPLGLIQKVIRFKPVVIGAPINLKGAIFKFFQTFNQAPCLGFEVYYGNKGMLFSGDTLYQPDIYPQLIKDKVMSQARASYLSQIRWSYFNMIILYVGPFKWNTKMDVLRQLPAHHRAKTITLTREYNSLQDQTGFVQVIAPNNTVVFTKNQPKEQQYLKKVDLLSSIEVFENISIKNFRDLLQSVKEETYQPKEYIIRQGTIGTKFYFIMSGIVKIFSQLLTNKYFIVDYILDSNDIILQVAISEKRHCYLPIQLGEQKSVIALTYCEILSIERQDFWFIFGEKQDDAGPLIKKLFSLYEARKSQALSFINRNSIFTEFNTSQKTQLEMILKDTNIKQNQILWTVGEPAKFSFLLARGQFKFIDCPEEELPEFDQPGTFFGEINNIMTNDLLQTSIIALKESQIFVVERPELVDFFNQNPGLFMQFSNMKYFC